MVLSRIYTTTCISDLLTAINEDNIIVTFCKQIIDLNDGQLYFDFETTPSNAEETQLDAILLSWSCPIPTAVPNQDQDGTAVINDDASPSNEVMWTSDKIATEIEKGSIFGSEYCYNSSDVQSSTTSDEEWREKVGLITPDLPAGEYLVEWSLECRGKSAGKSVQIRVDLNNTATAVDDDDTEDESALGFYFMETKDAKAWFPLSGFKKVNLAGTNTIDIDYKTTHSNYAAYIRRARLQLWRVE